MLHGKQGLGCGTADLGSAREVLASVVLGDLDENQVLASCCFFVLPRSQLVKVKLAH